MNGPWRLEGEVRGYAWGSRTALAHWLGREPSGAPEAELWLGAHVGAPSRVLVDEVWRPLPEVIAADPVACLGPQAAARSPTLPFLLKVLAVDSPLSIQAHPDADQAREGYAREQAAGVALDARERTFRDPNPKPELLVALDRFDALCGVRPERELDLLLARLGLDELRDALRRHGPDGLVYTVLHADAAAVERVVSICRGAGMMLVAELADRWPGDPGAALALLLNRVRLEPGEGLFVEPGQPHCYLSGTAIEVMASSDNVVRGGLTTKHVDRAGLLRILRTDLPASRVAPPLTDGVRRYPGAAPWFHLTEAVVRRGAPVPVDPGAAIALCLDGEIAVTSAGAPLTLGRGQAAFLPASAGPYRLEGSGRVFSATAG